MRWGKDNPAAKPEYATAKIAVWWDMNDCPIPEGYDARPPPATMMFICDGLDDRVLAGRQQMKKYNLFLAYSFRPYQMSVLVTSAEWLWDSLLAGAVVSETTRPLLQLSTVSETTRPLLEQCSERGESTGMFYCRSCSSFRDYKSLDDFTKHLSSTQHAMTVVECDLELERARKCGEIVTQVRDNEFG